MSTATEQAELFLKGVVSDGKEVFTREEVIKLLERFYPEYITELEDDKDE